MTLETVLSNEFKHVIYYAKIVSSWTQDRWKLSVSVFTVQLHKFYPQFSNSKVVEYLSGLIFWLFVNLQYWSDKTHFPGSLISFIFHSCCFRHGNRSVFKSKLTQIFTSEMSMIWSKLLVEVASDRRIWSALSASDWIAIPNLEFSRSTSIKRILVFKPWWLFSPSRRNTAHKMSSDGIWWLRASLDTIRFFSLMSHLDPIVLASCRLVILDGPVWC